MTTEETTYRQVPIASPSVGEEEWQAVREPLMSGWLTQGPKVAEFERQFAARHGVAHAAATTSCTTALHLALVALGVGPGDEVIVPAFTWIATANAVVYVGATPVFADVLPDTYNLDPASVAEVVSDRTRGVVSVHLFGLCADMDGLRQVLSDDAFFVEDAACAAGASYLGRSAGSLGDLGCFSFHPRKSVTTGEGGMVTADRDALAEEIVRLRNHGASIPEEVRHSGSAPYLLPDFDVLGFNYRMTDIQAAIGIVQLEKLDRFVSERQRGADYYEQALSDIEWLHTPHVPNGLVHAWQSYVAVLDDDAPLGRDALLKELHRRGVGARPGTHDVPSLGYYRSVHGTVPEAYPVAAMLARRSLALPLHNRMTEDDYEYVVEVLHDV